MNESELLNDYFPGAMPGDPRPEELLNIAGKIVELTHEEGWQDVLNKIEELKKMFLHTPEDYLARENLAGLDTGARMALSLLTNWINSQSKLIEKYADRRNQQPVA